MPNSPYTELLEGLADSAVQYVVIGVSGINFYYTDPGDMFATRDLDLLIQPGVENWLAAFKVLKTQGYELSSNGEPIIGVDRLIIRRMIERHAMVTATKGAAVRIDLVLDAGRIPYDQWEKSCRIFKVEGVPVPVGGLEDLIQAKKNAGRPKDQKFLRLFGVHLRENLKKPENKTRNRSRR